MTPRSHISLQCSSSSCCDQFRDAVRFSADAFSHGIWSQCGCADTPDRAHRRRLAPEMSAIHLSTYRLGGWVGTGMGWELPVAASVPVGRLEPSFSGASRGGVAWMALHQGLATAAKIERAVQSTTVLSVMNFCFPVQPVPPSAPAAPLQFTPHVGYSPCGANKLVGDGS
jgi:hypothetical protein